MDNTTFTKISNKLPPVKTGRRFGDKPAKTKKVGLFSERRFLIFTKKGPIEITFRPIHYTTAVMSLLVGFISIVYWSFLGLYSAIDEAQNNIITEASANFVTNKSNSNKDIFTENAPLNDILVKKPVNNKEKSIQSNISIPRNESNILSSKNKVIENTLIYEADAFEDMVDFKDDEKFHVPYLIKNKDNKNSDFDIKQYSSVTKNEKKDFLLDNKLEKLIENKFKKNPIPEILLPPKLDERAENYRFLASLDNELGSMEKVFTQLEIKLDHPKLLPISELQKKSPNLEPDSKEFLNILKQRLNILSVYKDAIQFIPLKPPMDHYYVSSKYGKRKHPVTKKWRFHHGIDLAGTWQENISVSADGIVIFAGYLGTFGKVIRIKHNFGIMTTYGHLAKIKVKKGDIVSEGQVIGKMGRTGRVDGAHLHYEISVNGKSKNPALFFKIGKSLLSRNSLKSLANFN